MSDKQKKLFKTKFVPGKLGSGNLFDERDRIRIIAVASKIPDKILRDTQKFPMWYDQAVSRMGGE